VDSHFLVFVAPYSVLLMSGGVSHVKSGIGVVVVGQ